MTADLHAIIESSLDATVGRTGASAADLEDWLDFRLAVLEALRRSDRRLRDRARQGGSVDRPAVERVHRLFERWYNSAAELLRELERAEAAGWPIANAEEFRRACRSSHVEGFEPEKLEAAADQFRNGRGRPLGEVVDAIRNRALG